MINLLFTIKASIASGTLTEVSSIRIVSTSSPIKAGAITTSHGTQLTVSSIEAWRTGAAICVLKILKNKRNYYFKLLVALCQIFFLWPNSKYISFSKIILTVQLPPFLQGLSEHSLTSISQLAPVKPGLQVHV